MYTKKIALKQLAISSTTVAIVSSLWGSQPPIVYANDASTVSVQYHYIAQDELTSSEKDSVLSKLKTVSPSKETATENQTIYLIYKTEPKKIFGILPATGETGINLLTIGGGLLLVLGISLAGKGKKKRIISSILLLTATGSILPIQSIQALEGNLLAGYNQVHQLKVGDQLPDPSNIKLYQYVGYVTDKDIGPQSTENKESSSTTASSQQQDSTDSAINNETLLFNLKKLDPTSDNQQLKKAANNIGADHKLASSKMISLVPMADKTIISDIQGREENINTLLAHFEDGSTLFFPLQYTESKDKRAYYQVADWGVTYSPLQTLQDYSDILDKVVPSLQAVEFRSENMYTALSITENQEQQMDRLYLEEPFNKVKTNIRDYLKKALINDESVKLDDPESVTQTIRTIEENKEIILLSLAYLDRWYDIDYGEINSKELTMFHTNFFGGEADSLDALITFGQNDYQSYSPQRSYFSYAENFASVTDKASLTDFLEAYREIFLPEMSDNDWFKQTTDAFIVETKSTVLSDEDNSRLNVYERLKNPQIPEEVITPRIRDTYPNMLLPLLTTSEDNVYIISNLSNLIFSSYDRYIDQSLKLSNPEAYQAELSKIKDQILADAELYRAHYDMWYRILPDYHKHTLLYFQPVWGGHGNYAYDASSYAWKGVWYSDTGKLTPEFVEKMQNDATAETTAAIQEVFGPSGTYFLPELTWAGAYAWRQEVNFVITPLLGTDGAVTLTHEMVHAFDYDKFLLGHNRRAGMQLEAFPEGMLQAPDRVDYPIIGFNSLSDYSGYTGTRYHNISPERFQNLTDLQQYMQGLFDLIYTLEYAEGTAILKQDKDTQRQWFHKLETKEKLIPGAEEYGPYGVNLKRDFTDEEWNSIELKTIDDLVDNDVTVRRESANRIERDPDNPEEVMNNGYHKLSLFAPIWATATTERVPGDLSFRRTAFELLAEKGYENGMVPYMSNQYKQADSDVVPDSLIFTNILPEYNGDYKTFKKAMYQERVQKLAFLKPVTINYDGQELTVANYEQLQELMDQAVLADIAAGNFTTENTKVSELKGLLHDAFLKLTDDYRTSIFTE
ncbi:ZmpA/ZmpB/ZmpC family metallo-endopeptidase [Streptococcus suis]|uniref:ZmpA/ZmpB/ZmpC family metallo-endopeptidase n=1 Tax=Streptococcus suis TaxID=1307 RepID=UPI0038BAE0F5